MLYTLLNFVLFGILFIDLLERRFDDFKNGMIIASYNMIYIYSKSQILFFKINKNINNFIDGNKSLLKIKTKFIEIINLNNTTNQLEFYKNGDKSIENDSDLVISSVFDTNSNCSLKRIIIKNTISDFKDFDISEIKFLLLELCIGNTFSKKYNTYKINLKTNNYNFYIVDNIFSREFFTYYMKNIHEPKIDLNDEEVTENKLVIKILDQNANSVVFDITDKNEKFIIKKTFYEAVMINDKKGE